MRTAATVVKKILWREVSLQTQVVKAGPSCKRKRASLGGDGVWSSEDRDDMPCKQFLLFETLPMRHAAIVRENIELSNPRLLL
jgi:hypothetical protein